MLSHRLHELFRGRSFLRRPQRGERLGGRHRQQRLLRVAATFGCCGIAKDLDEADAKVRPVRCGQGARGDGKQR
eukprot:2564510-Prymnesium_polylepis.1